MSKKSIPIENLLDALDEYDKEKYSVYNSENNCVKPVIKRKYRFTKDELNLINKHYGKKFWCECCSQHELETLLCREVPCGGCSCCLD
jgi:hypothetical protein